MQSPVRQRGPDVIGGSAHAVRGYALHGLRIASEIALPVHAATDIARGVDVHIERGPVALAGDLFWESTLPPRCGCRRHGDQIVIDWDVARFAVSEDRIVVDAVHEPLMVQLLIQPVWAILLTARGRQALHACAVERNGRAIAVAGESGSGKSTAALKLIDAGWRLLTDDLLTFDGHHLAYPGPQYVRLRPDRATNRAGEWDGLGKLRYTPAARADPAPVDTVVILDQQFDAIRRLSGFEAIDVLLRHIYNVILTHPGQAGQRLDFAMQLASSATIVGAPPRSLSSTQLIELASQGVAR